jgi:hypothetical protein
MCFNPEKVHFSSIRSAAQAVLEQHALGRSQEIYSCGDHFHLTTADAPFTNEVLVRVQEAAR